MGSMCSSWDEGDRTGQVTPHLQISVSCVEVAAQLMELLSPFIYFSAVFILATSGKDFFTGPAPSLT